MATGSSFASIVLPTAAVVATLLAGIVAAWAAYAVGVPRRKLLFALTLAAPVLPTGQSEASELVLQHHGTILAHPHVLKIQLLGSGSRDIPSQAFDSGKPIEIDVAIPIIAVLQVTSEPNTLIVPKTEFKGTTLKIGPSLIGKNQKVVFTLLADGARPRLTCQAALENVVIKPRQLVKMPAAEVMVTAAIAGVMAGVAIACGISSATSGTKFFRPPKGASPVTAQAVAYFSVAFAATIITIIAGLMTWVLWKRRAKSSSTL